ncbi:MAG: DNA recombination protein RmuC, partial [Gammaproteobacteria bacterium]|nr:DNA recombination protein RmuC [Gammaproteobacteria bacterium]
LELNQHITTEASNLTRALKGDKKLQGNWGEHKVELLLEQAGLRKGIEYAREEAFRDDDGGQRRPDFVIHLPEGKHIIIDSKVSLVDYTRFVSAETDEERRAALAAHVQALRNHVQGLAGKQYPELVGMNSPDFVFLFMPVEPAYLAAAEHSPALFEEAYAKRIAIVTSTTLLPVLRVVANLWTLQRQNQSTRELAEQGGKVYEKLRIVVEKLEKLGNQIDTVQKTYKDTFNSLSDGRGSLIRTVERFTELGVKVSKRLPDSASSGGDLLSLEEVP